MTWFVLFEGISVDGRGGRARFLKRTLDLSEAKAHYQACRDDPYSIGYVLVITETECSHASPWTCWESL